MHELSMFSGNVGLRFANPTYATGKADPFLRQTQDRRFAQDDHFLEDGGIRCRSYNCREAAGPHQACPGL